jgi:hypothetical protein
MTSSLSRLVGLSSFSSHADAGFRPQSPTETGLSREPQRRPGSRARAHGGARSVRARLARGCLTVRPFSASRWLKPRCRRTPAIPHVGSPSACRTGRRCARGACLRSLRVVQIVTAVAGHARCRAAEPGGRLSHRPRRRNVRGSVVTTVKWLTLRVAEAREGKAPEDESRVGGSL